MKFAALGLSLAMLLAACGPSKPTAEELAAVAERQRVRDHQQAEQRVAAFPNTATRLISRLSSLRSADVADLEGAIEVVKLFEECGLEVRLVDLAASQDEIPLTPEVLKHQAALKRQLVRQQVDLFPAIRKAYAAYMSDSVAGAQTNFRAVGAGNKTLRGASPSFSSKITTTEAHYSLLSHATRFRFSRAEYVYSLTGESWYFKVNGEDDEYIGR